MEYHSIILAFASIIFLQLIKCYYKKLSTKHKELPPKAKGSWPIIGHLPLLNPSKLPHKVLGTLADEYGPIFEINLGTRKAVVVSSSEIAKECLLINDKAVSGRPKSIGTELMSYNYAIFGFSPYGSYWRTMRKVAMLELLSNYRVSLLSHVWKSEIGTLSKKLYDTWEKEKNGSNNMVTVDMKQLFGDFTMTVMLRIIFSKQLSVGSDEFTRIRKVLRAFFEYVGSFVVGDALPWLRWLDLGGKEKEMKRVFKDIDGVLEGWLKEHKEKRKSYKDGSQDFMDVMLNVLDQEATKDCNYDSDTINKATCLMMIAGGTDTTTVTLTWTLSLLMNNPQTLKRAKEELNLVVGKERQVSEDDIPKLKYLQGIVKETLRLYPPGPLMGPREFIEDCTINGYHINKGTQLMVNLSKIFTDPKTWEDPFEFRPERFLTSRYEDIDVKGQHFELFPFGSGRRICPGISFGLQVVHLTLANVLHGFDYMCPNDQPIDMSESFGLTNLKTNSLNVLIKPSLPSKLYATL